MALSASKSIKVQAIDYNYDKDDIFRFICVDGQFITNFKPDSFLAHNNDHVLPYVSPLFKIYGNQTDIGFNFTDTDEESEIVLDFTSLSLPFSVTVEMFRIIDQMTHGKPCSHSILKNSDFIQFIMFTEMYEHFSKSVKELIDIVSLKKISPYHYLLWEAFERKVGDNETYYVYGNEDDEYDEYDVDSNDFMASKLYKYRKQTGEHIRGYKQLKALDEDYD